MRTPFCFTLTAALLLLLAAFPVRAQETQWHRVAVPVADLRKEPAPAGETLDHDPLEESQLLYGERVALLEKKSGWARVEAADQLEWTRHGYWQGYPGWVKGEALLPADPSWVPNLLVTSKSATVHETPSTRSSPLLILSLGSSLMGTSQVDGWWRLRLIDGSTGWIASGDVTPLKELRRLRKEKEELRRRLVETARLFIGDPYYWGGRSAPRAGQTGPPHAAVDCSGLVGLVYQASGIGIPRDAHEQYLFSERISPEKLRPGDLIFLHDPHNEKRITHVMLFAGEGKIIEGPGTGMSVRETDLESRLREAAGRRVSYGTYVK
ncbi:MAG: NlpC/P60 family protein [Candidatus Omnitrophica bacterium]|nr:NlpC/P60 family protein [Candidatus Omnitrophota bacterium]